MHGGLGLYQLRVGPASLSLFVLTVVAASERPGMRGCGSRMPSPAGHATAANRFPGSPQADILREQ